MLYNAYFFLPREACACFFPGLESESPKLESDHGAAPVTGSTSIRQKRGHAYLNLLMLLYCYRHHVFGLP